MSKHQKEIAERRHRLVPKYLTEKFPDCNVKYDGVEGHDHRITYNEKTVTLETKSCTRVIRNGRKFLEIEGSFPQSQFCFGRFKFDNRNVYPYKTSQHQDLVDMNGWYIFVVSNNIRGCPAKLVDVRIKGDWKSKWVAWDKIIFITSPNWLEELKKQVYG